MRHRSDGGSARHSLTICPSGSRGLRGLCAFRGGKDRGGVSDLFRLNVVSLVVEFHAKPFERKRRPQEIVRICCVSTRKDAQDAY